MISPCTIHTRAHAILEDITSGYYFQTMTLLWALWLKANILRGVLHISYSGED